MRKASIGKVIILGLVIFLTGLFVVNLLLPKHIPNVIFDGKRKTIIERFVTLSDLRNDLLIRADFYDPDLYKNSIELLGASGKFYFIQVCLDEKPVMKYCTREQAIDMILGNMIERKFIFNHDDFIFVKNMFERCFDSQTETMFLGEFMTECKIVEEDFANDIENKKIEGMSYSEMDRSYKWAKEHIVDGESK